MSPKAELPLEELAFRDKLKKFDPRLWIVHCALQDHFDGDASARQLRDHLVKKGFSWANVSLATMHRWIHDLNASK